MTKIYTEAKMYTDGKNNPTCIIDTGPCEEHSCIRVTVKSQVMYQ